VVTAFGKNYGRAECRGRFGALYAYFWDSSFDASKELNQPVLDVHDCSSLWVCGCYRFGYGKSL